MDIVSWNIQAAKGVDEITSVERIAHDILQLADADVICLQEVLVTPEQNQVELLMQHFPHYESAFGASIDRLCPSGRLQFGNLVLSRLPVLQIIHHKLPQPAEPASKHMPRQAVEVIVRHNHLPLRITTTHLDFFAHKQRSEQVNYLKHHHTECMDRFRQPSPPGGSLQFESLQETALSVYCGDFNMPVNSQDYDRFIEPSPSNHPQARLMDCWRQLKGTEPHAPTCGIFDHEQWPEGAHCRDFFFASKALEPQLQAIKVDVETAASDHQPIVLSLAQTC